MFRSLLIFLLYIFFSFNAFSGSVKFNTNIVDAKISLTQNNSTASAAGEIELPKFISSNMVLQRNVPLKLWGWGPAGENITAELNREGNLSSASVQITNSGRWELELPAQPTCNTACTLSFELEGDATSKIQLQNILIGDVWFAGGQSNMEKKLNYMIEADAFIADANNYPQIRAFRSPYQMSTTPLDHVNSAASGWESCTSEFVGSNVSAVAYMFALNIHVSENVPIGILQAYRGGTEIDTWISPTPIQSDPTLCFVRARQSVLNPDDSRSYTNYPSIHFNGQINPLKQFPIKGFLFYQGETNTKKALEYSQMMEVLVKDWRANWGMGDLPFYYVQLFNMGVSQNQLYEESDWADIREQQLNFLSSGTPNVHMAVTIDTNEDPNNSDANIRIHPKNKKPIGDRLALLALKHTYNQDIVANSPIPSRWYASADSVCVVFKNVGDGLKLADGNSLLDGFVVANDNKVFESAQTRIANDSIVVAWNTTIMEPVALRYGWSKNPICNLVNSAELPASPFRTDSWPSKVVYDSFPTVIETTNIVWLNEGESLEIDGILRTQSGLYSESFITSTGCDSISITDLRIGESPATNLIADAYTSAGSNADLNYGSQDNVLLKTHTDFDASTSTRKGYLKFKLNTLVEGEEVLSAKINLRLYYAGSAGLSFNIYAIEDDTWEENTITWNNAPAFGDVLTVLTTTKTLNSDADTFEDYELDITDFVKSQVATDDYTISVGLYDDTPGNNHIRIFSKENTDENAKPAKIDVITSNTTAIVPGQSAAGINVFAKANTISIQNMKQESLNRVSVYTLSGKRVFRSNSRQSSIDIPVKQKGIYLVEVASNNDITTKKVAVY